VAALKTKKNDASVLAFIEGVKDPVQRADCLTLIALMQDITQAAPAMWGSSIVGFGSYHYKYASGREGQWFVTGFAPRKGKLSLYLMGGLSDLQPILARLGKHARGKGCLYIKRLSDVNAAVLRELVTASVARHVPAPH